MRRQGLILPSLHVIHCTSSAVVILPEPAESNLTEQRILERLSRTIEVLIAVVTASNAVVLILMPFPAHGILRAFALTEPLWLVSGAHVSAVRLNSVESVLVSYMLQAPFTPDSGLPTVSPFFLRVPLGLPQGGSYDLQPPPLHGIDGNTIHSIDITIAIAIPSPSTSPSPYPRSLILRTARLLVPHTPAVLDACSCHSVVFPSPDSSLLVYVTASIAIRPSIRQALSGQAKRSISNTHRFKNEGPPFFFVEGLISV